ncbi:indolepyruvate ferredoxin oxidoreductase subunit alpha [Alkaliphilus transvaalensis]|uniref:indolepyruvate ferredoxin oxidoreductase subunit alpha n=1 Tax=Alkaliphilus transvaalensis TaxID=114628 RepID=UPI000B243FC4|nr:4Fe-4S binding protein [Alkaliphilus transvaalensis]
MSICKEDKNLKVIEEWCKGCGICVAFCPKSVLEMNNDKVAINDIDKCIKCGLCELRCPDYAIYLEGSKDEK